jgi:hypothetical protein
MIHSLASLLHITEFSHGLHYYFIDEVTLWESFRAFLHNFGLQHHLSGFKNIPNRKKVVLIF